MDRKPVSANRVQDPPGLEPLMEVSPLGMLRLKIAWPDLSVLEKGFVIERILAEKGPHQSATGMRRHVEAFLDLALADPSAYVRSVVAAHVSKPYIGKGEVGPETVAAQARFKKVLADKDAIVRAVHSKREDTIFSALRDLDSIKEFWAEEHPRRLAIIDNERGANGKHVAEGFVYATEQLLPVGKITVDEMLDILVQYLRGSSISTVLKEKEDQDERMWDHWGTFTSGKDIQALWAVIPKLPAQLQYTLLGALPNDAGDEKDLAATIAEQLDPQVLQHLLWRPDIPLPQLRGRIFKDTDNDWLRAAAMSSRHFELPDASITELVYRLDEPVESGKAKFKKLQDFLRTCDGATLAQHFFIRYLIEKAEPFYSFMGPWDELALWRDRNEERFKTLSRQRKAENELFDLRLAMLAVRVAPIGNDAKPEEWLLKQIARQDLVVPSNPWQTYLNFKGAVTNKNYKSQLGELPNSSFEEGGNEEIPPDDPPADEEGAPVFDAVKAHQALTNQLAALTAQLSIVRSWVGIMFWMTVAILALALYFKW